MTTTTIEGHLEIDHERGVIYFHNNEGYSTLRICNLPKPIPRPSKRIRKFARKDVKPLYQLDYAWPREDVETFFVPPEDADCPTCADYRLLCLAHPR